MIIKYTSFYKKSFKLKSRTLESFQKKCEVMIIASTLGKLPGYRLASYVDCLPLLLHLHFSISESSSHYHTHFNIFFTSLSQSRNLLIFIDLYEKIHDSVKVCESRAPALKLYKRDAPPHTRYSSTGQTASCKNG